MIAYDAIKNTSLETLQWYVNELETLDWENLSPYAKKWYKANYNELLAFAREQLRIKSLVLTEKNVEIKSDRGDRPNYKATVIDVFARDGYILATVDTFDYGIEECLITSILKVLS